MRSQQDERRLADLQQLYDENVDAFQSAINAGADEMALSERHAQREASIVDEMRRLGTWPRSRAERSA